MARPVAGNSAALEERALAVPPLGLDIAARTAAVDQPRLRADRLVTVSGGIKKRDFAGALLPTQ